MVVTEVSESSCAIYVFEVLSVLPLYWLRMYLFRVTS